MIRDSGGPGSNPGLVVSLCVAFELCPAPNVPRMYWVHPFNIFDMNLKNVATVKKKS